MITRGTRGVGLPRGARSSLFSNDENRKVPNLSGSVTHRAKDMDLAPCLHGQAFLQDRWKKGPCALARPRSSWRRGSEAELGGGSSWVRIGRVGFRRDLSDGQVSLVVDFAIPLLRRGAGAFIVTVARRSYLRSSPSLSLTMPSVVLAARRASCFLQLGYVDLGHLTCVRSAVRLLTPPCLCQACSN
ncbi:hypothetical protein GW17_00051934, partial [Ensete ventricosum]